LAACWRGTASRSTGAVDLGNATRTITVSSPLVTGTLGGSVSGQPGVGLVKAGPGRWCSAAPEPIIPARQRSATENFRHAPGAFPSLGGGLVVGDRAEFSLRGTSNVANVVYGFSGTGNVITVGSTSGGVLGFALSGGFNTQLNLAADRR